MRLEEEKALSKDLRKWFNKLKRRTNKIIEKYYEHELFPFYVNNISLAIEDMKEEYVDILTKHALNQFYRSQETTRLLHDIKVERNISNKYQSSLDDFKTYDAPFIRFHETESLFKPHPVIEDNIRKEVFTASQTTLARVDQRITSNLAESYNEGLGIKDAGRKIEKEFSSLKGWEAKRIARTEINSAQNMGTFNSYDELGVEYHQWWSGQDERVRDSHQHLHGKIVRVGNTFSNGLKHPGDRSGPLREWINCRCTSLPFIMPAGMMAPPGMIEFTEEDLVPIPGYEPMTFEDALSYETPIVEGNMYSSLEEQLESRAIDAGLTGQDLDDYTRMINDKNVEISLDQMPGFGPDVDGLSHRNPLTGDIFEFNKNERFIKYHFKNENLTIFESVDAPGSNIVKVKRYYDELPKRIQQADEIVLSSQHPVTWSPLTKEYVGVGGYVNPKIKSKRIYLFRDHSKGTLAHECAHLLEYKDGWYISNSEDYIKAFLKDKQKLIDGGREGKDLYVSNYAWRTIEKDFSSYFHREFSEDFAETVKLYFTNPRLLKNNFRSKYDLVEDILYNNKFKKPSKLQRLNPFRNSNSHVMNILSESKEGLDKYALTKEEETLLKELQSKEKLGFLDKHKKRVLLQKKEFNELNNKRLTRTLTHEEEKSFSTLYSNLQKELDLVPYNEFFKKTKPNIFDNIKPHEKTKYEKYLENLKKTEHSIIKDIKYINKTADPQKAVDEIVKRQKLTGYSKELANKWSGASHMPMNDYLKGVNDIDLMGEFKSVSHLKKYVDDLIELIDTMPKNKCLKEDTLLFRGVTDKDIDLSMFVEGKTGKLKTFTSTSYDADTAADTFAMYTDRDGAQGWLLKIHAPKGTKGVAINEDVTWASEEFEYLLSPNQKYVTHKVDKEFKIIEIELIN